MSAVAQQLRQQHAQSLAPVFIDPARHGNPATQALALQQTMDARAALYHPGPALRQEIGLAAGTLKTLIGKLDEPLQAALGGRILGSEGLLPNEKPAALLATLERVAGGTHSEPGSASAKDRAVVIALMGDIGALYADTGATTGVEGRSMEQAASLRTQLGAEMKKMGLVPTDDAIVKRVQDVGGSGAVGPTKKQERTRPENDRPPRTGIHNLGHQADEQLGIPADQRLPRSRWDVAHIRSDRVLDTTEPLVGHMSGSPAEILQVWDMLRGVKGPQQYVGVLDAHQKLLAQGSAPAMPMAGLRSQEQEERLARVAGADAFLVGLGYHSAVEVMEGTLAYTGQDVREAVGARQDATHLFGHGAASSLVGELLTTQTRASDKA